MQDHLTAADRLHPQRQKLAQAIGYLRDREQSAYCLDAKVKKLPAQKRPPTVLDRWLAKRPA
jgi:hypothetical protein